MLVYIPQLRREDTGAAKFSGVFARCMKSLSFGHERIFVFAPRDDRCSGEAMTNSKHPQERKKLLILGLHGYLQNGESFRARIGSVRKALKSRADFAFIDAPYDASVEALGGAAKASQAGSQDGYSTDPERILRETEGTAVGSRSWWTWDEQVERPSKAKTYFGCVSRCASVSHVRT